MQMKGNTPNFTSVASFIRSLQANGQYTFVTENVIDATGKSVVAVRHALRRLIFKKKITRVRRGFFVIVPNEYLHAGSPPPSWYIHQLMEFHGQDYYVALLSAAALHGAAHQQPQEFQVVTTSALRPIKIARSYLKFFVKKEVNTSMMQKIKVPTGYINVSTPETTAYDLIKYVDRVGDINNAATVLNELAETITPKSLSDILKQNTETAYIQRLGYLFELLNYSAHAKILYNHLKKIDLKRVPLRSGIKYNNDQLNKKWNVYINTKVEIDE